MKSILKTTVLGVAALLLLSCDNDIPASEATTSRQAAVTLLVTPNGLGDNGYDDDAAMGIFAFMEESNVPLRLLLPDNMTEAETMYRQWLEENADRDSVVLVAGSPAYTEMLGRTVPKLTGQGSRILLFESDETLEGVSTVMINRYGTAYLAGAMSNEFDSFILAAAPGYSTLEEAIIGFSDGHRNTSDGNRDLTLQYLADSEDGFAMPDSAYHVIYRRAEELWFYDEMIFPLLGGSVMGIIDFMNNDTFTAPLMVGMDVDQKGQSSRIPFSMVIRIGEVLKQYLTDWQTGKEWPATRRFRLAEGAADIVITPHFTEHLDIWDERYEDEDTFLKLYEAYYEEAVRKEAEYEAQ